METEATATEFQALLEARGVTRRSFMKLCGAIAAAAGLSQLAAPKVAQAVEDSVIGAASGKLCPAIWIEGASCTGCTESFAQVDTPDPATVVLEMLSLNYSETLSAAAGYSMEQAKAQTIEKFKGEYILVYEGAVLEKWGGQALRVANEPGTKHLLEAAQNAKYVVAFGSCAVNGGWMGAEPNSSDALGVSKFLKKNGVVTPVVNIPGCPGNPEHLVAVLVDVLLVGKVPELTADGKPKQIFGQTIHDNCERRGHFENGEFVRQFGSEEEAKGYCLYAMGCRGPQTYANCGVTLWNHGRSWCVQAGSPCIGCCEADPDDPSQNWVQVNTPFYERHRDLRIGSIAFQPTTIAGGITVLAAAALAVHGFGMKKTGRTDGGADFEKIRKWDAEHPDQSIGQYSDAVWAEAKAAQVAKPVEEAAAPIAADIDEKAAIGAAAAVGTVAAVAKGASDDAPGWKTGTTEDGVETFAEGYKQLWNDTFNAGSQHVANSVTADLTDPDA
ncbi:MAG: hydrogenase small subunit, partial [Eggerthellaceae bacterium]|nr:hydrogenase small subunit [Eggerthellaceae bacterium]